MLITTNMFFRRRNRIVEWMNNPSPDFCAELTNTLSLQSGFGVPTFSRASTATVKDFEGLIKSVKSGEARFEGARRVENLLTYSEAFNNGAWTKTSVTINPDAELSPIGTLTGDVTNAAIANGKLAIYDVTNSSFIAIDVAYSPGDSWSRISYTFTAPAGCLSARVYTYRSGTSYVYAGVTVSPGKQYTFSFYTKSSSGNIAFWGAQVEDVTGQANQAPSEYVSTNVLTDAPYHGANVDGVKYFETQNGNSVTDGVVTESIGADIVDSTLRGYFSEGSQTNYLRYSEQFDNSVWTNYAHTQANQAISPDGRLSADRFDGAGYGRIYQEYTGTNTTYTGSVFVMAVTGSFSVTVNIKNRQTDTAVGTNSATVNSNSWTRISATGTTAGANTGVRFEIVMNSNNVYLWGAQVEKSSYASSYIPTTNATVTRAVDSLTYPGSGNIGNISGTISSDGQQKAANGNSILVSLNDGTSSNRIELRYSGTTTTQGRCDIWSGGVNQAGIIGGSFADLSIRKASISYSLNNVVSIYNGSPLASHDIMVTIPITSQISIGRVSYYSPSELYGTIKNVKIWKRSLSDSFLQRITTP